MSTGFTHESARNETCEWYTPAYIFEALKLSFDLDPCHPMGERLPWVPAREVFTQADNGLVQPWHGKVWLNPPYGAETPKWLAKMANHGNGVALVFSRTDTGWFHDLGATAGAMLFLRRRVRFVNREGVAGGSPGAGSLMLAWGPECVAALERSGLGLYVKGWNMAPALSELSTEASKQVSDAV